MEVGRIQRSQSLPIESNTCPNFFVADKTSELQRHIDIWILTFYNYSANISDLTKKHLIIIPLRRIMSQDVSSSF